MTQFAIDDNRYVRPTETTPDETVALLPTTVSTDGRIEVVTEKVGFFECEKTMDPGTRTQCYVAAAVSLTAITIISGIASGVLFSYSMMDSAPNSNLKFGCFIVSAVFGSVAAIGCFGIVGTCAAARNRFH